MIGVLELILCDIGNTTYHFLVNGKHKKYFLDEKVPKFDEELYFVSVNEKGTKRLLKKNPQAKNIKDICTKFETKLYIALLTCWAIPVAALSSTPQKMLMIILSPEVDPI